VLRFVKLQELPQTATMGMFYSASNRFFRRWQWHIWSARQIKD